MSQPTIAAVIVTTNSDHTSQAEPGNLINGLPPQTHLNESPEFDSVLVSYVDPTYKLETWSDAVSFAPDTRCSRAASDGQTWGHFGVTLRLWSKDGSGDVNYRFRYITGCMPAAPVDHFSVGWYAVAPAAFFGSTN